MNSRPLLLGHRGVRGRRYGVRENTIPAFDLALQHGCDGFEFDVRLSADGCGVICHDARFGNSSIAKNKAAKLPDLPLLEQVIESYADRAFLDIELKVRELGDCLLAALSAHPPRRGYVVSSFLPEVLAELGELDNSLPLGIICETRRQLARWRDLPVQYVMAKAPLVTPELVKNAHSAGKRLFCWTVNTEKSILRMAESGVDGIISDRTDLLSELLRG